MSGSSKKLSDFNEKHFRQTCVNSILCARRKVLEENTSEMFEKFKTFRISRKYFRTPSKKKSDFEQNNWQLCQNRTFFVSRFFQWKVFREGYLRKFLLDSEQKMSAVLSRLHPFVQENIFGENFFWIICSEQPKPPTDEKKSHLEEMLQLLFYITKEMSEQRYESHFEWWLRLQYPQRLPDKSTTNPESLLVNNLKSERCNTIKPV